MPFRPIATNCDQRLNVKSDHIESILPPPHTLEGFARHRIAEVRGDAEVRFAAPRFDPGGNQFDRVCGSMYRKRSEEHTSELQSLMRISYAVFCLKKKKRKPIHHKLVTSPP